MADKAWQYRGEIQGRERETNAALGVDLDLERGVNINSILEETNTVEKSVSIEDIITSRIRDEAFDDPIRKEAPREKASRELPELSQEKSEKGLGEIYEDMYMKEIQGVDKESDELKEKHEKITTMYNKLVYLLDRLANSSYTPSYLYKDMSVNKSTSSIMMEESTPAIMSNEQSKAPEEVYARKEGRKGILVGDSEITQEQRQSDRRASKVARKKRIQQSENDLRQRAQYDEKAKAILQKRKDKELVNAKNVVTGVDVKKSSDSFKSTQFFKKLQVCFAMID